MCALSDNNLNTRYDDIMTENTSSHIKTLKNNCNSYTSNDNLFFIS